MDILSLLVALVVVVAICYVVNNALISKRDKFEKKLLEAAFVFDETEDHQEEENPKEPEFVTISFGTIDGFQEVIMDKDHFWDNVVPVLNDHGWFDDGNGNWYNLQNIKKDISVYDGHI